MPMINKSEEENFVIITNLYPCRHKKRLFNGYIRFLLEYVQTLNPNPVFLYKSRLLLEFSGLLSTILILFQIWSKEVKPIRDRVCVLLNRKNKIKVCVYMRITHNGIKGKENVIKNKISS